MKCAWCLSTAHAIATCPLVKRLSAVVIREAEQRETETAERMIAFRTYAGALSHVITEHGLTIPPQISVLNPDAAYPPYRP